jgi:phospholipase/carboxylesterase
MKTQPFENITISPPGGIQVTSSVIWLHGLGADGHDFVPIVEELRLPQDLGVRFIFPHAPVRPVTLNGGLEMPAWFDIHDLDFNGRRSDEEGLEKAYQQLVAMIEGEMGLGIAGDRIILAGFSQGGALALYTGLHYPGKLGGVIALSTYFPATHLSQLSHLPPEKMQLPIFMAHGTADSIVPFKQGEMTQQQLSRLGFSMDWHVYPMAHSVCAQEIVDIARWLQNAL